MGDRHQQRDQRIGPRIAQLHKPQPHKHRRADAEARQRVACVGAQNLAAERARPAQLPPARRTLHRRAKEQRSHAPARDEHRLRVEEATDGARPQLPRRHKEGEGDKERGHGLKFAVAVGVFGVGRLAADAHRHQANNVGDAVEERVETICHQAQRTRGQADAQLGRRGEQVEHKSNDENAADRTVITRHAVCPSSKGAAKVRLPLDSSIPNSSILTRTSRSRFWPRIRRNTDKYKTCAFLFKRNCESFNVNQRLPNYGTPQNLPDTVV